MDLNDKKLKSIQDNSPLKTEEILSIINKSENLKFEKSNKLLDKISNNFKKYTVNELAKKEKKILEDQPQKTILENEETKIEKSEEKQKSLNSENKDDEKKIEEKKYTELEANTLAEKIAQKKYDDGMNDGIKKIKEELEKGEDAIAIALKNTIDNLLYVSPKLMDSLNKNINDSILKISSDLLGYKIDTVPEKFLKKINTLCDSIKNSINRVEVFLSKEDHSSINKHLQKNKSSSEIIFKIKDGLNRGDLVIKSGGIEIKDILIEKIHLSSDTNIENEVSDLSKNPNFSDLKDESVHVVTKDNKTKISDVSESEFALSNKDEIEKTD